MAGPAFVQRTALVVETNAVIKMAILNLVEMAGLTALQAGNADEALRILEHRADVALVITSVVMQGGTDGVDLAYAVEKRWPAIKVIVVSGKRGLSESDLPTNSLFLAKPFHDEELIFEIRSLTGP